MDYTNISINIIREQQVQDVELAVELAGVKMKNPVMLASGTAGYGIELSSLMDLSRVGALVLKSVTVEPSKGNPEPRVWETAAGMLNSIGLENVGVEALITEVIPALEGLGTPIFASIVGDTVRSFARLATRLESAGGVDALEVNVSCPNVEKGGIQFGVDPGATSAVVMSVKENCGLPVFVKLTAAVADISRIAVAAQRAGADGLTLINTVPGLAIDPMTRRPCLGGVIGGLSERPQAGNSRVPVSSPTLRAPTRPRAPGSPSIISSATPGFLNIAVPTETALAPAIRNSSTSPVS